MATQPDPETDTIDPQSPTELPPEQEPAPNIEPDAPDETSPLPPDYDAPGRGPDETPPPL